MDVSAFLKEQDWKCVAAIDGGIGLDESFTDNSYGVSASPTFVVIDPKGVVSFASEPSPTAPRLCPDVAGEECGTPLAAS